MHILRIGTSERRYVLFWLDPLTVMRDVAVYESCDFTRSVDDKASIVRYDSEEAVVRHFVEDGMDLHLLSGMNETLHRAAQVLDA